MKPRTVIVGGGAAGLIAAITAARQGAAVTVLEQNDRPGRKICATGNGKCNLTNMEMPRDAFRGTHPEFAEYALKQFSVWDTVRFFTELGIYTVNKNGYLYPHSGQAQSVVDVLCMEARSLGVKVKTNQKVTDVFYEKSKAGEQGAWKIAVDGWTYESDTVILANGSKASAIPGSDGSGYALAKHLGHTVIEPLPALTALKCKGNFFSQWAGVRTEGKISLYIDNDFVKSEQGELQLTEYGISGIPVFQLSRYAIRGLYENKKVSLRINFLPEFDREALRGFLATRAENCPYKNEKELLVGLFPDKLSKVLTSGRDLLEAISAFPLTVTESLSFKQAQICSGGVDTAEVDPFTMESKKHPGLFFAGELLDIDGTCGGYNLQWAWSSGTCAGTHAAKKEKS